MKKFAIAALASVLLLGAAVPASAFDVTDIVVGATNAVNANVLQDLTYEEEVTIEGGNQNGISSSAVGANGNIGLEVNFLGSGFPISIGGDVLVDDVTVTALNGALINSLITYEADVTVEAGNQGSISSSAVGANAGINVAVTVTP